MVSIIIPVYNAQKTIKRCLDGVLSQKLKEKFEIIVVNDGSTDETGIILEGFGSGIGVLKQEHKGPAAARNAGIKAAQGKIAVFIDSDCFPAENWLSEMLKPFESKEVAGVQGAYKTEQKSITARFSQLEFEERYQLMKRCPFIDLLATYSAAYKRNIFDKVGLFEERLKMNEDVEFSFRLVSKGYKLVFNPKAVIYHRHRSSPLAYFKLKLARGFWRMKVYEKYPRKLIRDTYTPKSLKLQFIFGFLSLCSLFLSIFYSNLLLLFSLFFCLYLFSMGPLFSLSLREDPKVFIAIPFFVSLRGLALALGSFTKFARGKAQLS